ncbi:MAG: Unknown protein [uncultured Thiotrichaceae bacterium]|uniref:Prepilin-type N-terminal cleavage/methylation domain-containing protein n=1 Tax=uncultured Thiotrichaceae bacterium TaxID=298394 RepID=A0A6S6SYK8_9GAMM|nr:MAG: Unknown protein [uncultured Thiotrichaceae bacterium]
MLNTQGYSLLELMIAMLIGIFLISIAITTYSGNKTNYKLSNEMSEMEANARVAMNAIQAALEHVGYPSIHIHPLSKGFYVKSIDGLKNVPVCSSGTSSVEVAYQDAAGIYNANLDTRDNGNNDRFSMMYYPDNPNNANAVYWQDCGGSYADYAIAEACSGDTVTGEGDKSVVYNSFWVNNAGELRCRTSRNVTYAITNGIEHIQLRYGVKINDMLQYHNATAVTNNALWSNVVSAQVAFLAKSENQILEKAQSKTFVLLDRTITKNDKYMRRVYSATVSLRNMSRE